MSPLSPFYIPSTEVETHALCFLFVTAFEGGVNHWVESVNPLTDVPPGDVVWWGRDAFWDTDFKFELVTHDEEKFTVGREEVQNGLFHFSTKYPTAYSDWISDEYDAETADIFLQCVIFKDVIYG